MNKNKKISYNIILKNFIRFLTIGLCLFYLISGEFSHIIGGVMFLITSIGADVILRLIKINLTNSIDFILQGFIVLCLFIGKMYNVYSIFPWWDLFLHFLSGILVGIAGLLILSFLVSEKIFKDLKHFFKATYAFVISIASAALWEIWEFAGDQLFGLNSQLNSLMDTMSDICICTLGGVIVSIMIYNFYKKGKFKFIGEAVETFSKINIKEEPNNP